MSKKYSLYKLNKIFQHLKENMFLAVNGMIKDDRNGKMVDRFKIKNILDIFEIIDTKNPELNKNNDEYYWSGEKTYLVLKEWFTSFKTDTEKFVSQKARNEIKTLSAPEYTKSSLKYLEEERQRCSEYIFREFHENINTINFKYLIKENAKVLCQVI